MRVDGRAVSAPLGVVLLLGIVVMSMAVVVTVGATALDDTREQMDIERAEKILTQFDSKSAMVALGESDSQSVSLAEGDGAGFSLDEDAGWMNLTVTNESTGDVKQILKADLGALTFERGNTSLAYQGGGVWKRTSGGTTMVSPPEFHFRAATLTLPVVQLTGETNIDGSATVRKSAPTSIRYPNASQDAAFVNPLTDGRVNVTVHSDYYRSWGQYFDSRTKGNVYYDDANDTATIELVVPFNQNVDSVVATTTDAGITVHGSDPPPDNSTTGVDYPLPDSRIESRIEDCEQTPSPCNTTASFDSIDPSPSANKTFYTDSNFGGVLDVNTSNGNVTVVVDGEFEPSSVRVSGDNQLTVLVRDGFSVQADELNSPGNASDFVVAVHSDGDVDFGGDYKFVGTTYAPGSDCDLNGGGSNSPNIVGGVVCETATVNGNPNDFEYDPDVANADLSLTADDATKLTFLHVTVNEVEVDDD